MKRISENVLNLILSALISRTRDKICLRPIYQGKIYGLTVGPLKEGKQKLF